MKLKIIAPFFIFSVLSACSLPLISPTTDLKNLDVNDFQTKEKKLYTIDMGHKGGSSLNFKIKLSKADFAVKSNENGKIYNADDIDKIKIILFNPSSFTSGSIITTPVTFRSFTINSGGANTSIGTSTISVNFTNVPGNLNPYRIGIQALKGSKIITKAIGLYGLLNGVSTDIYAVSDSGGDETGVLRSPGSGKLTVDATNLTFTASGSTTTSLGSTLKLIDAYGANIDSQITIIPNTVPLSSIKLISFYLVDSSDLSIKAGPFDFSSQTKYDSLVAGNTTAIKFSNVPAGSYYVASAAYNNTTPSSGANITNNGTNNFGLGLGNFVLSNAVSIDSNLIISTIPTVLSINLN